MHDLYFHLHDPGQRNRRRRPNERTNERTNEGFVFRPTMILVAAFYGLQRSRFATDLPFDFTLTTDESRGDKSIRCARKSSIFLPEDHIVCARREKILALLRQFGVTCFLLLLLRWHTFQKMAFSFFLSSSLPPHGVQFNIFIRFN